MGCKTVGPVCSVMRLKEPSYTYREEKEFAPVFLAVAVECAAHEQPKCLSDIYF